MSACADDTGGHVGALEPLSYEVQGRVSSGRMDAAMSWMDVRGGEGRGVRTSAARAVACSCGP